MGLSPTVVESGPKDFVRGLNRKLEIFRMDWYSTKKKKTIII